MLAGPWARDLPDPPQQGRYSRIVQRAIDADANPHLARPPRAGLVRAQGGHQRPGRAAAAGAVNAILADPDTIFRLGTAHPHTGAVEHLDEQTYRPGAKLARLVRARDGTCRYPGRATPAQRCDLDHVIAYPAGPTTAANLQTLCRVHHGFKHHGGWTVSMTPDGVCTWTAPNGAATPPTPSPSTTTPPRPDGVSRHALLVRVTIRVRPGSGRTDVGGRHSDALIVRVRERAVDGKATTAALTALAVALDVRPTDVVLVRGTRSRTKIVDVPDTAATRFEQLLDQ